ncbi:unnamed protein product [Closterium sp. NIES-64]|nr:unnamed protein product [Closterium sp. NIES-64]
MAAAAPSGDADVEDYMGDLSAFLPPEDASKLRDQQQERQKKLPKPAPRQRPDDWKRLTWQERRQQVREEKDKAEAAVLAEGLAAPIPPSNIGFKLLQKMGFKGPPEAERTGGMAGFSSAGKMGVAEIRGERHRGDGARVGEESGVTAGRETSRERGKAECTGGDVTGEREKTAGEGGGGGRSGEAEAVESRGSSAGEAERREEALRGDFEERRKGRWSEWKVRGALRKARTALVHLEGGEEWLRSQAVRIGAAPSSTDSHGGGGSGLRKARTALEGALLLPGGCSVAARRVLCCCQEGALLLPGGCSVAARRVLCCCQEGALLLPGGCSVAARCIESYESEEALASMCLYESEEALASMCPGEEEEAH